MHRVLPRIAVLTVTLMCALPAIGFAATDDAVAQKKPAARRVRAAPAKPPAAVHVWAEHLFAAATSSAPQEQVGTIRIVGTRNGTFSGKVLVRSSGAIKGLQASSGGLKGAGSEIAGRNVSVRYAVSWDRSWRRNRPGGLDVLLESPPEELKPSRRVPALAAVWVTVRVPKEATPGVYTGRVKIDMAGQATTEVPIELTVTDWTLPEAADFTTWVGMIQSPDSVALEYEVPMWSEEHWRLIDRSFSYMKLLGCRNVFIPLLARTNFGNAESMVRWIKTEDGTYEHDFTIMDRYLDVAEKHLGKPKMVTFQAWELYLSPRSMTRSLWKEGPTKGARAALQGKGPRVSLLDPKTGKVEAIHLPCFEDPASKALWQPVWDGIRKRMTARGLEKTMMLGMTSDIVPPKEHVALLHEVSGGLAWTSHAHPGRLKSKPAVGNKVMHGIADLGYEAHVYNLDYQVNPDKGRQYGWRQEQLEVRFGRNGWPNYSSHLQLRLLPAFNITGGQRGIGRLAADAWYVIRDKRNQRVGAAYHRYPEAMWRNLDIENWILAPGEKGPIATGRLENLREGLQVCEARIAIERALLDPAKRKQLGETFARECEDLLNERQRTMWRTIWSNEEDLASMNMVRARHPIEALWQALAKAGKKLPGYWDSKARKMRSSEATKGRTWYAASGWQARDAKLFALAGQVAKKLGG
jgi:Glycoside hydrolase 123, catalytic domain/Glycoside hydrolase 123, N-terminal domain